MTKSESEIEKVLSRMFNWKMTSAYEQAEKLEGFPNDALILLEELSSKFGNCGWNSGSVFDELRVTNDKIADILGYELDPQIDTWIKKKN